MNKLKHFHTTKVTTKYNKLNSSMHIEIAPFDDFYSSSNSLTNLWESIREDFIKQLNRRIFDITTEKLNIRVAVCQKGYQIWENKNEIPSIEKKFSNLITKECVEVFNSVNKPNQTVKLTLINDHNLNDNLIIVTMGCVYLPAPSEPAILALTFYSPDHNKTITKPYENKLYLKQQKLVLDESSLPNNYVTPELVCAGNPVVINNPLNTRTELAQHTITVESQYVDVSFDEESAMLSLSINKTIIGKIKILALVTSLTLRVNQTNYKLAPDTGCPSIHELIKAPYFNESDLTDIPSLANALFSLQKVNNDDKQEPYIGRLNNNAASTSNPSDSIPLKTHSLWLPKLNPTEQIELLFDNNGRLTDKYNALVKLNINNKGIKAYYRHLRTPKDETIRHYEKLSLWHCLDNIHLLTSTLAILGIPLRVIEPVASLSHYYHLGLLIENNIEFNINNESVLGRTHVPLIEKSVEAANVLKVSNSEKVNYHPATAYLFSRQQLKISKAEQKNQYELSLQHNNLTSYIIHSPTEVIKLNQQNKTVVVLPNTPIICGILAFTIQQKST